MKLLRMECWGLISRFSIHRIEETMWFSHAKIKHLTSSILTHGLFAPTVYNFFHIFCYTRLKLWPNPVLVLIILSQACKNWTVLNTWLFKLSSQNKLLTHFSFRVSLQVRMITSVCIMTLCFVLTTVLVVIDTKKCEYLSLL